MAVAVTIEQAREALSRLDPESRALLELSVRRGMDADEIAGILRIEPSEKHRRVEEVLDRLARELSLEGREERAELRATLPDLPADAWTG
jgi:DNA-directed RNA polymerase specialized sigma24 family protein